MPKIQKKNKDFQWKISGNSMRVTIKFIGNPEDSTLKKIDIINTGRREWG